MLLQEGMCVKAEILEKLKEQQNITVNLDGWKDTDLSADSHTGEYLRGNIQKIHLPWQFKALLYQFAMCQLLYVCGACVCMQI